MEKMTFYEISERMSDLEERMESCVDEETGEITSDDYEKLLAEYDALDVAEQDKIEGVALSYKNIMALVNELKIEKGRINDRIQSLTRRADGIKKFLDEYVLRGNKFETARVRCAYRRTKSVNVVDEGRVPAEYIVEKVTKSPDKMAIKKVLLDGGSVDGCDLVETNKLNVK